MRRVDSILRQVIAEEVERLKDPRLGLCSITGVETAPNLRTAVVYFSTLDLEDAERTRQALESAAPRLRRAIGAQVRMKYVPALTFELDRGVATGERIEAILRRISRGDET
ncbi:MAG: ribosome-binding factor A [Acidimicrobiia bacterium]|jgi:ribosome-binding factor A|nr:MAG: ribosome-binding factor A [Acidimicrobiia bacterium]